MSFEWITEEDGSSTYYAQCRFCQVRILSNSKGYADRFACEESVFRRWNDRTDHLSSEQINSAIREKFWIVVVTCGNCGAITTDHDAKVEDDEWKCPHCGTTDDPSGFPDLFYDE